MRGRRCGCSCVSTGGKRMGCSMGRNYRAMRGGRLYGNVVCLCGGGVAPSRAPLRFWGAACRGAPAPAIECSMTGILLWAGGCHH